MPIYEFVCMRCKRRFRKLVGVVATATSPECPDCQSVDLKRQISRFARLRGEEETLDQLAERIEGMGDSEDPRALRGLMQEMGKEMGEDFGDDFDQILEEEAAGTSSDSDTPLLDE